MNKRDRQNLYVLIGAPGSGKTACAHTLRDKNTDVVSIDEIREELNTDTADAEARANAYRVLYERVREALNWGADVVVDDTHTSYTSREDLLKSVCPGEHVRKIAVVFRNPRTPHVTQDVVWSEDAVRQYQELENDLWTIPYQFNQIICYGDNRPSVA